LVESLDEVSDDEEAQTDFYQEDEATEVELETSNEPETEPLQEEPETPPAPASVESNPPVEDDDEDMKILNDKFEVGAKTLADLHEEKKIDSIMEAISINHRYMFLQELFDGDNDQFQKAIEKIENSESFDSAVEMLVQDYSKDYFWDMNSEEVKEFLKVVFRYFR
jgi:hypothetical protein